MLIGGVVNDQFGDDAQATPVGLGQERFEIIEGAIIRVDLAEVGDVVTAVA